MAPERPQVGGDGRRAPRRREQVQQHRDPPVGQPRRGAPPEDLLQPDREHRLVAGVVDAQARPAGHREALGREGVEPARVGPRQEPAQRLHHVDAAQVPGAPHAGEVRSQPVLQVRQQRVVGHVGPRRTERAVQERHPLPQARGGVRPAQQGQPLACQPVAQRLHDELRRRVGEGRGRRARSRRAAGRGARPPRRPAHATTSSSRSSAGAASVARSRSIGAADRMVASRRPAPRSASATASHGSPVSPEPGGSTAPVPDVIRYVDPPGRSRAMRSGWARATTSPTARSSLRCSGAGPGGTAARSLPTWACHGPDCGPPRRRRAQRRDQVAARGAHVVGEQGDHLGRAARPDQRGAVQQRRGRAGGRRGPRTRPVPARSGARRRRRRPARRASRARPPSPRRAAGRAGRGRRRRGSPSTPARARTP